MTEKILTESEVEAIECGIGPMGDRTISALCATVKALRAESHACGIVNGNTSVGGCCNPVVLREGFRCADCLAWFHRNCINEHFTLDAYVKKLRELREQGAIDDWKKEIASLQFRLSEVERERDAEKKDHQLTIDTFRQQERIWQQKHDDFIAEAIELCKAKAELWERNAGATEHGPDGYNYSLCKRDAARELAAELESLK